ncbi:unnamed protein product [Owenia fusiformis]|uniref:VWFA domain-containing protein n=1 Tax=Owenia fusiformis TaxID=6347 RepID=A0A8S4Q573_OWEFU|nr:unnamed protein product [Owenia fusiformis]
MVAFNSGNAFSHFWTMSGLLILCGLFNLGIAQPSFFKPDESEGLLPTNRGVCMDAMLVFDTSCSITMATRRQAIEFSKKVMSLIPMATIMGTSFVFCGAVTFDSELRHEFYMNSVKSKEQLFINLDNINVTSNGCKSKTYKALKWLPKQYFTRSRGDRDDFLFPDLVIIFTDDRTIPGSLGRIKQTRDQVEDFIENDTKVFLVLEPNSRERDPYTIVDVLDDDSIFELDDPDAPRRMAEKMVSSYPCGLPRPPVLNDDVGRGCVDLVFAFDIGCSHLPELSKLSKDVATKIITELSSFSMDYRIAAVTFAARPKDEFVFQFDPIDAEKINENLRKIDTSSPVCRSATHRMLQHVRNTHFSDINEINYRKAVNQKALVIFYDGLTSPARAYERTIREAQELLNQDVDIFVVKLDNNRNKDGSIEFKNIVAGEEYLFPRNGFLDSGNVEEVAQGIAERFGGYICKPSEEELGLVVPG